MEHTHAITRRALLKRMGATIGGLVAANTTGGHKRSVIRTVWPFFRFNSHYDNFVAWLRPYQLIIAHGLFGARAETQTNTIHGQPSKQQ